MATIYFEILSGMPPFEASISPDPNGVSPLTGLVIGPTYSFTNLPDDTYTITITDDAECEDSDVVSILCSSTTTTEEVTTTTTTEEITTTTSTIEETTTTSSSTSTSTTTEEITTTTTTVEVTTTSTTQEVTSTTTSKEVTTTTTEEVTTTTTTEGVLEPDFIEKYNGFNPGECGVITYPYSFNLLSPSFVAILFYDPDRSYTEVEYIEVTNVDIPAGLDVTYNGSTITTGVINADDPLSSSDWEYGQILTTRSTEGQDMLIAKITFKIKLAGYVLTDNVIIRLQFAGCFTTTTTTTTPQIW